MGIEKTASKILELSKKGLTIDLQEEIMKLREEAIELQNENLKLKEKNYKLKKLLKQKEELRFDGNFYWKKSTNDGPFCQNCFDGKDRMVRLQKVDFEGARWHCLHCNKLFE
jgi:hypothetical protein